MTNESNIFDIIVMGGGPGGYATALYGAAAGLNIALVEEDRVGGTCLLRGCIPAKALLQTAEVAHTIKDAEKFGSGTLGSPYGMMAIQRLFLMKPLPTDWARLRESKSKNLPVRSTTLIMRLITSKWQLGKALCK